MSYAWKCINQSCPDREPTSPSKDAPICYTCGEQMRGAVVDPARYKVPDPRTLSPEDTSWAERVLARIDDIKRDPTSDKLVPTPEQIQKLQPFTWNLIWIRSEVLDVDGVLSVRINNKPNVTEIYIECTSIKVASDVASRLSPHVPAGTKASLSYTIRNAQGATSACGKIDLC